MSSQPVAPQPGVRTFATMAHFDPRGRVAPHVRRHIEALLAVADRLVVVSTADLQPSDEAWLRERVELLRRENFGYDFYSMRTGLLEADDLADYDRVIVCNDTFVGPLVDYERILAEMHERPVDFWGLTWSDEIRPHVQSYFVCFRSWVVRSEAFTGFWQRMTPLSERYHVIRRYEVGLTGVLEDAGFRGDAYFRPTRREVAESRSRMWWRGLLESQGQGPAARRRTIRDWAARPANPCITLADAALPDGRLPLVKIDTLRNDPGALGAARLLDRCETALPDQFAGVRDYLNDVAAFYAERPVHDVAPPSRQLRALLPLVRYS